MSYIKCIFTSIWRDGSVINNPCEYNTVTGEIFKDFTDTHSDGTLENEYITLPDGTERNVCPICHSFTMMTVMVPDNTGKGIHESLECEDPDCDNKQ